MSEITNVRYIEYVRQTGEPNPQAALERDIKLWPGGKMVGYMLWLGARWQEWHDLKGYRRTANGVYDKILTQADHDEFDAWLKARQP